MESISTAEIIPVQLIPFTIIILIPWNTFSQRRNEEYHEGREREQQRIGPWYCNSSSRQHQEMRLAKSSYCSSPSFLDREYLHVQVRTLMPVRASGFMFLRTNKDVGRGEFFDRAIRDGLRASLIGKHSSSGTMPNCCITFCLQCCLKISFVVSLILL